MGAGDRREAERRAPPARGMASDARAVASFADGLPPPPPQALVAAADGLDVKLSWQPVTGDEATIRYRLVRCVRRDPLDENAGTVIAEGPPTTTRDIAPPVGERLRYPVHAAPDPRPC